jgi:phosphatidylserine synthase
MLIAWVLFYDQYLAESFINPEWITLFIAVLAAMLMVSPIRYRSLKGVDMTGKKPFYYLVGVIAILTLVALEPPLVLFLVGVTYLSSGVLEAGYRVWTRGRPGFNRPSKHPAASRLKGVDGDGKQTDRLRRLY